MMLWFKALAWQQKLAAGGIVLVVLGLIALVAINWGNSALETATSAGKAIERAETLETTIERVEKANEAQAGIQYAPAKYCDVCVRNSRTPSACRYRVPGAEGYQLCPAATGRD